MDVGKWLNKFSQDKQIHNLEEQLENVTFRLGLLLEFGRIVVSSDSNRVIDLLLSSTSNASGIPDVSVSLIEKGDLKLRSTIGSVDKNSYNKYLKNSPIWECFQSGQAIYDNIDTNIPVAAVFPLIFKDQMYGVLALHSASIQLSERDANYIQVFVDFATIALKNNWEHRKLEYKAEFFKQKATLDPLTGLYNRQMLPDIFKSAMAQSKRMEFPISILMFDIDHFKRVNDSWGHPFGDIVIREVAHIAKEALRANDSVFRYGGEEFIMLLSGAKLQEAANIAERVRKNVERHPFTDGKTTINVTISLGAVEWDTEEEPKSLIDRADQALYKAKEEGRNRVKTGK